MIGLAVITYGRPLYLSACIKSLEEHSWGGAFNRLVIRDISPVGAAKNRAITDLLECGCTHLFLMEDDILMLRSDTCLEYVEYAEKYDLHHLNFHKHGPLNVDKGFTFGPDDILCYPHCVGAFSYYSRYAIEKVGLIDETFVNCWEHVEHSYRIGEAGLTTPIFKFADHPNSTSMLMEIPGSVDNSSISGNPEHAANVERGRNYWTKKHGWTI